MEAQEPAVATSIQISATEILRAKHAALLWLFDRYRDDDDARETLARQICNDLSLYSALEEDFLYPVVRHAAAELVRRAINAHAAFRMCIEELSALSAYDPAHGPTMARLIQAAEEHIEDEETRLFPFVEGRLPSTLRRVARDMVERTRGAAP